MKVLIFGVLSFSVCLLVSGAPFSSDVSSKKGQFFGSDSDHLELAKARWAEQSSLFGKAASNTTAAAVQNAFNATVIDLLTRATTVAVAAVYASVSVYDQAVTTVITYYATARVRSINATVLHIATNTTVQQQQYLSNHVTAAVNSSVQAYVANSTTSVALQTSDARLYFRNSTVVIAAVGSKAVVTSVNSTIVVLRANSTVKVYGTGNTVTWLKLNVTQASSSSFKAVHLHDSTAKFANNDYQKIPMRADTEILDEMDMSNWDKEGFFEEHKETDSELEEQNFNFA